MQEQSSETINKSPLDTRTFPEIWKELTPLQKETLRYALIQKKCTTTRQTVSNWANDKKRPTMPPVKNAVAQVVSRVIGSRVSGDTLFPAR